MEIKLTKDILNLESGNLYFADSELDYEGGTITINGDCHITIKDLSFISNATIDNSQNHKVYINILTTDVAFKSVKFVGNYIQGNEIVLLYTTMLENYNLPVGFSVKTLSYAKQGDFGGSIFNVIPFSQFSHRLFLYPFDPKDEISPIIVYAHKDKYFAEELGIFKSGVSDNSLAESNRAQLERHGGRNFIIKFGLGHYHINNVNMDNCTDWKGYKGSYYSMNLEGSSNDYTESDGKTFIITDRSNFIYSVERNHFKCSVKYCNIETIGGNHFTDVERMQKRMGYGFTRFDKDPLTNEDAQPINSAELGVMLQNVYFYGFWAGFYSGQWSTGCTLRTVTFNGCRYGFYSELSSNLSIFENIGIHSCAFGLTVGGDKCTIRRVEITPENWYRDEDALQTDYFYGYRSRNGFHGCYIEDVYLEDYMADAESRQKYIILSVSASSNVIVNRLSFQALGSDSAAYHLEIFRPVGYPYLGLQTNKSIVDFKDGDLPVKVRTSEDWVITGISHNGSIINTSESYKVGGETKTVSFFSGRGILHFWTGKPSVAWNVNKLNLYFSPEQHKYYEQLIFSNEKKPVLVSPQLINGQGFSIPPSGRQYKLKIHIKGKCKMNLPFYLHVGDLGMKYLIKPYYVSETDIIFDFVHHDVVSKNDITLSVMAFYIYLSGGDNVDSDFMPNNPTIKNLIEVEHLDFELYE